jgi:hypothetical protein
MTFIYLLLLLIIYLNNNNAIRSDSTTLISDKFTTLVDNGNYTCDELMRWLGTEKHYSNNKKELLFGMLGSKKCQSDPVMFLDNVHFGIPKVGGTSVFFQTPKDSKQPKCSVTDSLAVVFLSNFSINNNFSHFLHGLLRLFCALIDAKWIVWDQKSDKFIKRVKYTIWLDEYFKITEQKLVWLHSLGDTIRPMKKILSAGSCITANKILYGSGCVKLLPPEKWFGYPGCRAKEILPAFGHYFRQIFMGSKQKDLLLLDEHAGFRTDPGLRISFAVRDVGDKTGRREISNLKDVQALLKKTQHIRTSTENITFEHLDVPSTVRYMAGVHIFVSVHGAGMTNMFFMNPGSAVVEIIPYPLCNCHSPDYFYGTGGYYHGSSVAQKILHYHYCVPNEDVKWHSKIDASPGHKCSWKHLHSVESVKLDTNRFLSLMRNVERDLVIQGTVQLTQPIINMNPHANG